MADAVPTSQSKTDQLIIGHAVVASVATFITVPASMLIGRYLRTWRYWNHLHAVLNATTLALIIATFVLGYLGTGDGEFTGEGSDTHHKLGLAVFIIVIIQSLGGVAGKLLTSAPRFNYVTLQSGRPALRYVHIVLGIVTAALLYVQIHTGFEEWDENSESQTTVPNGVKIAFWVLLGIEVAAYVVGWIVMEPLGRKKRTRELEIGEKVLKA